jgi:hypothetical protein
LQAGKFGNLSLDILYYCLWTYPETVPFSNGKVRWFFFDLTYSRKISGKISLGIRSTFTGEYGYFDSVPDLQKHSRVHTFFIAWDL